MQDWFSYYSVGELHCLYFPIKWSSGYIDCMEVPHKAKTELLYDSTIQFLGIYPQKLKAETQIFIHPFSYHQVTMGKKKKNRSNPSGHPQMNG